MFESQILQHAVNIFTSADLIGAEAMELWPLGVEANKVPFMGIWDDSGLVGSNEVHGDGRTLNRQPKDAERRSTIIEVPRYHPTVMAEMVAGTNPTTTGLRWFRQTQDPNNNDVVKRVRTGETVPVKRILAEDEAMMSVLLTDTDNIVERKGSITG